MACHWGAEDDRFEAELTLWNDFSNSRQKRQHLALPIFWLHDGEVDKKLSNILAKLNEWREFEAYHQREVGIAQKYKESTRRLMEQSRQLGGTALEGFLEGGIWRSNLINRQSSVDEAEKLQTWIRSQSNEILKEVDEVMMKTLSLRDALEEKLRNQAQTVYQDLVKLGGSHCKPARIPPQWKSSSNRIYDLNSETTRLLEERQQWSDFLHWRREGLDLNGDSIVGKQTSSKKNTDFTLEGYVFGDNESSKDPMPTGSRKDLKLWVDYVAYRQLDLDKARSWAECQHIVWEYGQAQRMHLSANDCEQNMTSNHSGKDPHDPYWMERAEEDAFAAEERLRQAQQQLIRVAEQLHQMEADQISRQQVLTQQPSIPGTNGGPQQNPLPSPPQIDSMPPEAQDMVASLSRKNAMHGVRKSKSGPAWPRSVLGPVLSTKITKNTRKKTLAKVIAIPEEHLSGFPLLTSPAPPSIPQPVVVAEPSLEAQLSLDVTSDEESKSKRMKWPRKDRGACLLAVPRSQAQKRTNEEASDEAPPSKRLRASKDSQATDTISEAEALEAKKLASRKIIRHSCRWLPSSRKNSSSQRPRTKSPQSPDHMTQVSRAKGHHASREHRNSMQTQTTSLMIAVMVPSRSQNGVIRSPLYHDPSIVTMQSSLPQPNTNKSLAKAPLKATNALLLHHPQPDPKKDTIQILHQSTDTMHPSIAPSPEWIPVSLYQPQPSPNQGATQILPQPATTIPPSANPPPLRRSERLRHKAACSDAKSSLPLDTTRARKNERLKRNTSSSRSKARTQTPKQRNSARASQILKQGPRSKRTLKEAHEA